MAVLTKLTEEDVGTLLADYAIAGPSDLSGISAGSVNSNFTVEEAGGRRLFLRLYEEQDGAGAAREAALIELLARGGVPTPSPLRRSDGKLVSAVRGKPAALFPWCEGSMRCQASVTPDDASQVGAAIARVHLVGAGQVCDGGRFRFEDLLGRLNAIARSGSPRFVDKVAPLREALERTHFARDTGLPSGLIHGDLFRDNVLWDEGGRISALLDFESASHGSFAYDLMVCVLSWCVGDDLDPALACAMREGYESVRPLTERERKGLLAEGSFAALRFTITRITDYAMREGAVGPRAVKDWKRFRMRYDRLQTLGVEGLSQALGLGRV